MNFCYLVRCNAITSDTLHEIKIMLARFHYHREIFIQTSVRIDISMPRQHALKHYPHSICLFGSPNGLCSSMTESKHIKAVKEPWRRSSRYKALLQMLRTNSRLDKMLFARRTFAEQGMMAGSTSSYTAMLLRGEQPAVGEAADQEDDSNDMGPTSGPKVLSSVELACTPRRFLFFSSQTHSLNYLHRAQLSMHTGNPLYTYPTAIPPRTPPSLFIWSGPPQFPSLLQSCRSQWMPTILWSYFSFSLSCGSFLCTQWPLRCWRNVSRTYSFHPNMARSSTALRHCICRGWSRAPWDERHDSWTHFSFLFLYISRYALSMRSHSLVLYSRNWTRRRYRTMGGKTKIWDQWPPESGYHSSGLHCSRCTPYWCLWVLLHPRRIPFFSFFGLVLGIFRELFCRPSHTRVSCQLVQIQFDRPRQSDSKSNTLMHIHRPVRTSVQRHDDGPTSNAWPLMLQAHLPRTISLIWSLKTRRWMWLTFATQPYTIQLVEWKAWGDEEPDLDRRWPLGELLFEGSSIMLPQRTGGLYIN